MANILGIFKGIVSVASTLWSLLHTGTKPTLAQLLPQVAAQAFAAVDQALAYGNLNTKEQIDSWLDTFDASTGSDAGALNVAPSMPLDKEEEMLDHVKEAVRLYAYHKAKLPGYVL